MQISRSSSSLKVLSQELLESTSWALQSLSPGLSFELGWQVLFQGFWPISPCKQNYVIVILGQWCLRIFSATVSLVPDEGLEEREESEEMDRRNSRFWLGVVVASFWFSFPDRLCVLDFRGTPAAFFFGSLGFGLLFGFLAFSPFPSFFIFSFSTRRLSLCWLSLSLWVCVSNSSVKGGKTENLICWIILKKSKNWNCSSPADSWCWPALTLSHHPETLEGTFDWFLLASSHNPWFPLPSSLEASPLTSPLLWCSAEFGRCVKRSLIFAWIELGSSEYWRLMM